MQSPTVPQLPFVFAKRHGVLLQGEGPDACLQLRDDVSLFAVQEA